MEENVKNFLTNLSVERLVETSDQSFDFLKNNFGGVNWNQDNLKNFLSSPNNILLVAKSGDKGLGFLRSYFLPRYDNKGTEILLHEIDVLPSYQKQGVATFLIEKLKEIATQNQISEIWLVTNRSNIAAMALYEKTGGKAPSNDDVVFVYEKL